MRLDRRHQSRCSRVKIEATETGKGVLQLCDRAAERNKCGKHGKCHQILHWISAEMIQTAGNVLVPKMFPPMM